MKTLKYSRQRESIKACLMSRHDHPTADVLYSTIREEYPNISLGTVYRNLNLLVELGEIRKLTCGDGKDHFDADTSPHYHFVCQDCGRVLDLPMEQIGDLNQLAQTHAGGRVDSHAIYFYGSCGDCQKAQTH
ncbi:MAG: transcriptional repressor [Lachnospiraceae bacterium]|nr:transcriptional repressor [Lachnospiraceae bacterium]